MVLTIGQYYLGPDTVYNLSLSRSDIEHRQSVMVSSLDFRISGLLWLYLIVCDNRRLEDSVKGSRHTPEDHLIVCDNRRLEDIAEDVVTTLGHLIVLGCYY
jgi:hypothetical protein